MPARSKSTNTDALRPNIVLLEEYDALAAAITSALKKFAPQHATVRARSVKELETLAAESRPELFIFDVDPPWAGITGYLEQLRDSHPKARALVVGTAVPSEITAERGLSGGLQLVEKPFELASFGAAVQALLGPWRESEFRGTLRALSTIDVLLLHCAAATNVILEVRSRSRTGQIHISAGQISHAETSKLKGEDALVQMLGWPKVQLSETKLFESKPRTIGADWPAIVVEILRENRAEIEEPPRAPEIAEPKAGKKIVVIDDTEMLLIFVEDVLAMAQPDLQITTAPSGTDGLREIARVKPDLVLLDYSLPDFNGDDVCRALLENEQTANVPVLMMSGHVAQMNAAAARFANIVATIEKPFLSDALVGLVRRTLAGERQFVQRPPIAPVLVKTPPAPAPVSAQPKPSRPIPPPPSAPAATSPSPQQAAAPTPSPPPRQEPAPPPVIARESVRFPIESRAEVRKPAETAPAIRVAPTDGSGAVLGLFLEVLSMQLTSQLQMGAIRARPASLMASLRLESATARSAIPAETAFQIGPAQFSGEGRISLLRIIPTTKPFQPAQMRSAFEIGGVAVIPNETRARVQLTPAGTTPMTMELLAHLELNSVELTPNFQVAQLILNWPNNPVRVTLNPKAPEQTAAQFQMRVEKLDHSGRIAELLLFPTR